MAIPTYASQVKDIGEQLHESAAHMVQSACVASRHIDSDGSEDEPGNVADATYLGGMATLGCLTPTAMMVAIRPSVNPFTLTDDEKTELMAQAINPETLTFAALMAAKMQVVLNTKTGGLITEFGPHILWEALQAWEKVFPDKRAEDYLAQGMCEAARKFGEHGKIPEAILKGRQQAYSAHNRNLH